MTVSELKCTSCFAPLDPSQGQVARCRYCGATFVIGQASAVAPPPPAAVTAAGSTVFLEHCGNNKIAVIKVVRTFTGAGLAEAKDLVDSAPCAIPTSLDPARIQAFRQELLKAGARAR